MCTSIKDKYFRQPITNLFILFVLFNVVCCNEENIEEASKNETEDESANIIYITPSIPSKSYFFESFDDEVSFEKKWIRSSAVKDDVDENVAKYDGKWALESLEENSLAGDKGLVLKSKAKHSAISVKLTKPFHFDAKPFIVQYEVNHQNGQECGGSYIKLLSDSNHPLDLNKFNDKTPYTIMFGPDKCGNDHKHHFIFRHVNPLSEAVEEKHCKRPNEKLESLFKDKKTHLNTLIIRPDSSFEVMLDHQVINSGHLLEDFTPPVNPPKEMDDPNDVKPGDWDDSEKVQDPNAAKPADWDENAPRQIVDQFAEKPEGWLDDESELIPDPEAVKPDDWDDEMDGEWEAPLVTNPKCTAGPGCGKWKAPVIDNPNYKGKWKAPLLDNPNYKGKWSPRKIHNPDFFEDLEPFKMTPIAAVGIELWSMSEGIYFDNFLITESLEEAQRIATETFDIKMAKINNFEKSLFTRFIEFSNAHPWIYGVYVLALAIPVVLIFVCCCADDGKGDADALRKKTDEPDVDDEEMAAKKIDSGEQNEVANEVPEEDDGADQNEVADEVPEEDDGEDQHEVINEVQEDGEDHKEEEYLPDSKSGSEVEKSDDESRKSPRVRRRKD